MRINLPSPPRFDDIGTIRRSLGTHLHRIQLEIEQAFNNVPSKQQVGQGSPKDAAVITASVTLQAGISFVEANTTSAAITVTLPLLTDSYQMVTIVNSGTGTLTVDGNDVNIIGGATLISTSQYDAMRIWPGSTEYLLG